MKIPALSKDASQVNLSNSILRHFGCETFHDSFKPLDEVFERNKDKKVVLFLFDGFGRQIQELSKEHCPYIHSHGKFDLNTVYPPTTVAATTAVLSGRYPIETGWLGWTLYNPGTNEYVTTFSGTLEDDASPARFVPYRDMSYKTIFDLIDEENGSKCTSRLMGFDFRGADGAPDIRAYKARLQEEINKPSTKFIYAYWTEPDHNLHENGIGSDEVNRQIEKVDKLVKDMTERNKDVLFISIADHGHIICDWIDIRDYPDFADTVIDERYGIEARFASFRVKEGREKDFLEAYERHFSQYFACYSKEEILNDHLFGYGTASKEALSHIGDYVLIGTSNKALGHKFSPYDMKSHHAGSMPIETELKVGIYNDD